MPKSFRFLPVLSLVSLVILGGCSSPKAKTSGAVNHNSTTVNAAAPVKQPLIVAAVNPDPATNSQVNKYVKSLAVVSASQQLHGVWMQSGSGLLANYQGTTPVKAASISKVATTLVALKTLTPDHRFITQVGGTGRMENGVLKGDLVIEGGGDPLFVWEEAIALGNEINKMGIKQVTGDLVITGKFYMNFNRDAVAAGNFFKIALDSTKWTPVIQRQYQTLPPGTPRPKIAIAGKVKAVNSVPSNITPLIRHSSYPLAELLKKMNQYSNNDMAEMFADAVGGAAVISKTAAAIVGVPENEIYLVNGSGLTYENQISPRAATGLLRAVEDYLKPYNMTVADVFMVMGQDKGVLEARKIPKFAVVKSGSLDTVSGLVGVIPTQKQGNVWFTIMNSTGDLNSYRKQQDVFLTNIVKQWGIVATSPPELTPSPNRQNKISTNEILYRVTE
ncbi:D-alanyl-D-alanine carboxypeptidase [Calothrix sp. PCC 6303]|uniref:D-alanyl-D-alanine carboxypeptidase n=1 Tax=Calothrix sp. PCC 6303 TaxID=1170562 RepID=UPI0002A01472|nr:D-alanyl-D-alanine carboxypeptidase [Calothrix sp. PCC 6303]AFZ00255.1 peptidase S13 D-Ala-D-Ala carboxypeptidase C [Calothrix sp. PCC 6303]